VRSFLRTKTIDVERHGGGRFAPMSTTHPMKTATRDGGDATAAELTLIGQYDSPFTRRVAVALQLLALPYRHLPWSVWADADKIAVYSPLRRVPVLLLEDGSTLVDSFAILDTLDERVGEARALLPRSGPVRRDGLRVAAFAAGLADKAVSLVYERVLRKPAEQSALWAERCSAQIRETLALLEREREGRVSRFWFGASPTHADVAVACGLRFLREAHPDLVASIGPALTALAEQCEELPAFRAVVQPLIISL
jgi:glutathione S-transferase